MTIVSRLHWRCRRGTKELDLLLQGFLDSQYALLDPVEKDSFETLLELQDPELIDWLWGQAEPPRELASIVARIRASALAKFKDQI